jgi:hypothetical protein
MSLNFPDEPNDGDIFEGYVYNATRNVWDVKLPSDNNIEDLNNVNLTSPANGQALVYNTTSSNWINQNQTFSGLTDTSFASPVTGDSLVYNGTNWVNGPRGGNAIINGDFDIWQRSSSANLSLGYPAADRWLFTFGNAVQTGTFSRQSFSPGELSVPGYGQPGFYARVNVTNNNSSTYSGIEQRIEDVRTFSAQQVTMSFWAKASSALSLGAVLVQNFGSGGSTEVGTSQVNVNLTSSWQRFTYTVTLPSVSGKTIGAGSHLGARLVLPLSSYTIDIWGVQIEAGSVATPFKLAGGGSKAVELALCQRYYYIIKDISQDGMLLTRANTTAIGYYGDFVLPVRPRLENSTIFSYAIVAPSNVLHKPNVRWDTISDISLIYQNQRLFVILTPGTNDTASYGLTLHGVAVYMNAEL